MAVEAELTEVDYKKSLHERTLEAEDLIYSWQGKDAPLRRAANLLESVIKEDNDYAPALIQLSRLARKKRVDQASAYANELLKRAEEINPDDPNLISQKIYLTASSSRNIKETERLAKRAKELGIVNDPWIYIGHAKVYMLNYNFKPADTILQQAVDLGPGSTEKQRNGYITALQDQVKITYNQSDNKRLLELAEKATSAASSDNAWVWGNLATTMYRANEIDKGIEYFRKALSIMNYGRAKRELGLALHAKAAKLAMENKKNEAQKTFEEALTYWDDIELVQHQFKNTDIEYLVEHHIRHFVFPNKASF